jgi:hypothetical protein
VDKAPDRGNAISRLFGTSIAIIGDIHCPAFPGTPHYGGESLDEIVERVLADAHAYAEGGVDGVIVENHGDIPFLPPDEIGPEIIASMAAVARAVRLELSIPVGINLLANHAIGALAVAHAAGARFIRVNQWVNAYVSNEGIMEGRSAQALRYRRAIGAADVAIFADVHVKHGSHAIVDDRPVSEQAGDVEFFDADVAIATGNRTGDAVPDTEIESIRSGTHLPTIAGSGITLENADRLLPKLDGAIVGSSLKRGGVWWNEVQREKVAALMDRVAAIRERGKDG